MHYDYKKVLAVINNERNLPKHAKGISNLIDNFYYKWRDDDEIMVKILVDDLHLSYVELLTRLKKNDSSK
jgi:hypothetical protein